MVEVLQNPQALSDFDVPVLEARLESWGLKPRHGPLLLKEYYRSGGRPDFSRLQLGRGLEAKFGSELLVRQSTVTARTLSHDGTVKFLLAMNRGGAVEAVLMNSATPGRAAGCVSSQIGCAMGCDFCARDRKSVV